MAELWRALADCDDVNESEVTALLQDADPAVRRAAASARMRTRIRRALAGALDLAREEDFSIQETVLIIERLAAVCDIGEPYLEMVKQVGLRAARAGRVDVAIDYFQMLLNRAVAEGQRQDRRSARCMRFLYDREIGEAVTGLARELRKPAPQRRPAKPPYRLGVMCSSIQDEDGPSIVTLKRILLFVEFGFAVDVLSTELSSSGGSSLLEKVQSRAVPFSVVPAGTPRQRIEWITTYYENRPCDAILYEASGIDYLAQLAASVGMAPVQVWDHKGFEPQAGRYDVVAQALSPEQVRFSRWPEIAKFYGTPIAIADEIDAATPMTHAEIGVPEGALVIGTFGRMEKCLPEAYLNSITAILLAEPHAWLVLAGPDGLNQMRSILQHFEQAGVGHRVRYLGRRQSDAPRLVKSIDLYCDTHPWNGGQSLMDAMQAGVPIVAMRKPVDAALDPHAVGPSAVADVMLGGIVELADPDDVAGYVRIARELIADPNLRAEWGRKIRERALQRCSVRASTFAIAEDIAKLIASKSDNPQTRVSAF